MSSGIHVETLQPPTRYTPEQLERVMRIAHALSRGRLVLCEPPQQ